MRIIARYGQMRQLINRLGANVIALLYTVDTDGLKVDQIVVVLAGLALEIVLTPGSAPDLATFDTDFPLAVRVLARG